MDNSNQKIELYLVGVFDVYDFFALSHYAGNPHAKRDADLLSTGFLYGVFQLCNTVRTRHVTSGLLPCCPDDITCWSSDMHLNTGITSITEIIYSAVQILL
jgi:hypothetical protein